MENFSWKKALWKATKAGAIAGLGVLVATGDFDHLLKLIVNNPQTPVWLTPIVVFAGKLVHNYWKQWYNSTPGIPAVVNSTTQEPK